eukprot:gene404-426_t
MLIDRGTNISSRSTTGETALHLSVVSGYVTLIMYLLEKGADVNAKDNNQKTPFECFKVPHAKEEFFLRTTFHSSALKMNNFALWFYILGLADVNGIEKKVMDMASTDGELLEAQTPSGRRITEVAAPPTRKALEQLKRVFGRYSLTDARPVYFSGNVLVFRALDHSHADEHGKPVKVVLKFLSSKLRFLQEIAARRLLLNDEMVVGMMTCFPNSERDLNSRPDAINMLEVLMQSTNKKRASSSSRSLSSSLADQSKSANLLQDDSVAAFEILSSNLSPGVLETFFCLVLRQAEHTLISEIRQDFAVRNTNGIRRALSQLLRCLYYVHSAGVLHADINPSNVMRVDSNWKLIDFDLAVKFGSDNVISDFTSLAYAPPEAVHVSQRTGDEGAGNVTAYVRSKSNIQRLAAIGRDTGIEPLTAHASYDIWSLGCVLYQTCHSMQLPLWQTNFQDEVSASLKNATSGDDYSKPVLSDEMSVDRQHRHSRVQDGEKEDKLEDDVVEDTLVALGQWTAKTKRRKLSHIKDPLARNLLSQILRKEPLQRLSLARILSHPFLSGHEAIRLPEQPAEFDVYVVYNHARYRSLVSQFKTLLQESAGLSVCSAEADMVEAAETKDSGPPPPLGMFKCRAVVCVLCPDDIATLCPSGESVQLDTASQRLLLECKLAVELRDALLVESIVCVTVGDEVLKIPEGGGIVAEGVEADLTDILKRNCLYGPSKANSSSAETLSVIIERNANESIGGYVRTDVTHQIILGSGHALDEIEAVAGGDWE